MPKIGTAANRQVDPQDEVRLLRAELREARRQLLSAQRATEVERNRVEQLQDQVRALRATVSWRITGPIRVLRRTLLRDF